MLDFIQQNTGLWLTSAVFLVLLIFARIFCGIVVSGNDVEEEDKKFVKSCFGWIYLGVIILFILTLCITAINQTVNLVPHTAVPRDNVEQDRKNFENKH